MFSAGGIREELQTSRSAKICLRLHDEYERRSFLVYA